MVGASEAAVLNKKSQDNSFSVSVPTLDHHVIIWLRRYGLPAILFAEDKNSRRQRLKTVFASHGKRPPNNLQITTTDVDNGEFVTDGGHEVLEMRRAIAASSVKAATARLQTQIPLGVAPFAVNFSDVDIVSLRPVSVVAWHSGASIVTGDWQGIVGLWKDRRYEYTLKIRSPEEEEADIDVGRRVTGMAVRKSDGLIACGSSFGDLRLINDKFEMVGNMSADERISNLKWHPHHRGFLLGACEDECWRVWDVEKQREVLLQEGFASGVHSLSVHGDGAIVAAGDRVGNIRLWDIRIGRVAMDLREHTRQVLSLDFHPSNGGHLLSSGQDRRSLVWDIRRKNVVRQILSHKNIVTSAKWDESGGAIVTAGFDSKLCIWNASTGTLTSSAQTLHAHRVLCMDVRGSGKDMKVVTGGVNRSVAFWNCSHAQDAGA